MATKIETTSAVARDSKHLPHRYWQDRRKEDEATAAPAQEHATQSAGKGPQTPSSFVNAAEIYASDMPGTVVRKLDGAFHKALNFTDMPAQAQWDARDALTRAARDVLAERARQVDAKGFNHARDDKYSGLQLAGAAASYLILAAGGREDDARAFWPWRQEWLKPGDQRRYLEKAGALLLAEMERLDRAAARATQGGV